MLLAIAVWIEVFHYGKGIRPPVKEADVPFKQVNFDAEKGLKMHYKTGTNITIPAGALTDKKGNPVTGEATLLYREFQNADEIFRSGIPMGNIGDDEALQSNGMFEIRAQQNGNELSIAPDKEIQVQLAAYRPSDGYNIYQLASDYTWEATDKPRTLANRDKLDSCNKLPAKPNEPINPAVTDNDMVIDVDADYSTNPQLAAFRNTQWKVVRVPGDNLDAEQWAFRVAWSHFKIVKVDPANRIFRMEMGTSFVDSTDKTALRKSFGVQVTPVLVGDDLEAALADFKAKVAAFDSTIYLVDMEEKRLADEADALNAFSINKMGVWNCDQYVNKQEYAKVKATFDFTDKLNPYFYRIQVYAMNHDNNTVQIYNPFTWSSFYLKTGSNTSLMAVLPNRKVAIFSAEDFKKVNFTDYANRNQPYKFNMKIYPVDEVFGKHNLVASI